MPFPGGPFIRGVSIPARKSIEGSGSSFEVSSTLAAKDEGVVGDIATEPAAMLLGVGVIALDEPGEAAVLGGSDTGGDTGGEDVISGPVKSSVSLDCAPGPLDTSI
jgi:hypothetical protein